MDSAQRAALTCEPDSVVDVFSEKPLLGNPVAVIMWDKFPSGHEMQQIAAWLNLSETTFVSDFQMLEKR